MKKKTKYYIILHYNINVNDKLSLPEMKQKTVRPIRNKRSHKRLDL